MEEPPLPCRGWGTSAHAHVHAAFLYPSNGSADCVKIKLSVLLGTAWATTALPCIFGNAWANRLCPGERCEILLRPVWNRAHFKQAATPTHTTSRLISASRDTARPWAMAPRRPGVPPVMPSTRCLDWRAARPTGWSTNPDPVYMSQKLRIFLSNFLLLSENYESLTHEIDPAEPEEDTDSVK